MIQAGLWKCHYCGSVSIHIGNEHGSSDTECPNRCPGRFTLVKEYPLATGINGIKDAFGEQPDHEAAIKEKDAEIATRKFYFDEATRKIEQLMADNAALRAKLREAEKEIESLRPKYAEGDHP